MNDLSRDIGGLEARMDEHDRRFDELGRNIKEGFDTVNARLDGLFASENRRKGALGVIKSAFAAGGVLAGLYEGVKAFLGSHHS